MEITVKDIVNICNGKLIWGNENLPCNSFSKDTRTIVENDVYIGIKGENFDGNLLYEQAFEKGASVCILQGVDIKEETMGRFANRALIMVEDTVKALQQIASHKRDLYNIPVVAVTGSVGKTSTKDIIASVLGTNFNALKTKGNLNNHIGLPLTILELKDHNALVVEMGMNNLGEISVLSKIAKPNIAVITNVGTSHIGNLGSRENILKAKLEILDGLKPGGTLIINNDNDMLQAWAKNYVGDKKIISYGIENQSDVMAEDIVYEESSSRFKVRLKNVGNKNGELSSGTMENNYEEIIEDNFGGVIKHNCDNVEENNKYNQIKDNCGNIIGDNCNSNNLPNKEIRVPIGGKHFVYNALSAISVSLELGIPAQKIRDGIKNFELTKSRMELINLPNDIIVINDCYNANYDSMKAAIEYLAKTKASRKIAILGDMLELGEFSNDLHKKVGEEVIKNKIDILITVGEMGKVISDIAKAAGVTVYPCTSNVEAVEVTKQMMKPDDIILVKASNGMKFKEIVEKIKL